jgi:NAD(P)H-hydrate epimerase
VTTDLMREVDRLAVEVYGVTLLQMMENAGRNLAELGRRMLGGSARGSRVLVAAGRGNNGGGGLASARHLLNWGAEVEVTLETDDVGPAPGQQLATLRRMRTPILLGEDALGALDGWDGDLILDAMVGYGLSSAPRGWTGRAVEAINALDTPVVSLDVPTGLEATTGEVLEPCIRASRTLTLALPKTGLLQDRARKLVGDLSSGSPMRSIRIWASGLAHSSPRIQ